MQLGYSLPFTGRGLQACSQGFVDGKVNETYPLAVNAQGRLGGYPREALTRAQAREQVSQVLLHEALADFAATPPDLARPHCVEGLGRVERHCDRLGIRLRVREAHLLGAASAAAAGDPLRFPGAVTSRLRARHPVVPPAPRPLTLPSGRVRTPSARRDPVKPAPPIDPRQERKLEGKVAPKVDRSVCAPPAKRALARSAPPIGPGAPAAAVPERVPERVPPAAVRRGPAPVRLVTVAARDPQLQALRLARRQALEAPGSGRAARIDVPAAASPQQPVPPLG